MLNREALLGNAPTTEETTPTIDLFAQFEGKKAYGALPTAVYSVRIEDSELKMDKKGNTYINITGLISIDVTPTASQTRPVTITLFERENFRGISQFLGAFADKYGLEGSDRAQMLRDKVYVGKDFTFTYQHQVNGDYVGNNWVVGTQPIEYIKESNTIESLI